MELTPGTIVAALGEDGEYASRWEVLQPFQVTRLRSTWFARSAVSDANEHRVLLTVCRYNARLLGKKEYVDNVRRRLMHEAEMLTIAHNALPEPVDLFVVHNDQDAFGFPDADRYRRSEPVLVTEALNGNPLDAWIAVCGCFTERSALSVARKVAELLAELNSKGILAYELRPEDILVDVDDHDRIWIGSCANYQTIDARGVVEPRDLVVPLSDFAYTAPEVEAGQVALDRRADVYSLGALLLFLLTAKRPAEAIGADGVVAVPGISAGTARLIGRCLAPAQHRVASAEALIPALSEAKDALAEPEPEPVRDLSVALEGRKLVARWKLPPGWTDADGIMVVRWRSLRRKPPDVAVWKVVLDEVPSRRTSWEETEPLQPGETWRYAVVAQRAVGDRRKAGQPVVGAVDIPSTWTAWFAQRLGSLLGRSTG